MKITETEVLYVAKLARLELEPDEVEKMTTQLDTVLSYVAKLNELDTDGVSSTTHSPGMVNGFREDLVHDSLEREKALKNSPAQEAGAFVVPQVIG